MGGAIRKAANFNAHEYISHQFRVLALAKCPAAEGKAVAAVLHDLPVAFGFADRIAALQNGRLVRTGTPEEIFAQKIISDVFGVVLRRFWSHSLWRYYCSVEEGQLELPRKAQYPPPEIIDTRL